MISLPEELEVLVAAEFIDMRKQVDGLCLLVDDQFSRSPQSKTVFVFYNRQRNKVKLLVWDKEGFMLIYKRLEKGKFYFPAGKLDPYAITQAQLTWLLAGLDFMRLANHPECQFSNYI